MPNFPKKITLFQKFEKPEDFVKLNQQFSEILRWLENYVGGEGGEDALDHSTLSHLNYSSSGHTGFLPTTHLNDFIHANIAVAIAHKTVEDAINGILKINGAGAYAAATVGTDYSLGTSALATGILKSTTTTGALTIAIAADFPTLNQNTTGTAANLSGTPALPNGTTATTQAQADASTKLATTAYVDTGLAGAMANPMTTLGDIITGGVDGTPARLGIGAANLKLLVNAAGAGLEFAATTKIKRYSRDLTADSGDVAYTGIGFKPSHVLLLVVRDANPEMSIGFDDGTSHYCVYNEHKVVAYAWISNLSYSIDLLYLSGKANLAIVKSFDNDGFTLTWTKIGLPLGTANIFVMAFR